MFIPKYFEHRRVLLIRDESFAGEAVCHFLRTMSCKCSVASSREALAIIEQETFHAILFDVNGSQAPEQTILAIKEIRPVMGERILLITSPTTAEPPGFKLPSISQEKPLPELWVKLEEIFASQKPLRLAPPGMKTARLIFDSLRSPLVAGVRGSQGSARQLAYQHLSATVNLLIHPREETRVSMVGQVLDVSMRAVHGLPVVLGNRNQTLAETTTSQFGEFTLELNSFEDAGLQIRLAEGTWIYMPFENMGWYKNSPSELDTES